MDAVAENWCVYVDDDYTMGVALPYAVRFGVKTLYTPIFVRYMEFLGDGINRESFVKEIKEHFSEGQFNFKEKIEGFKSAEFIYQAIGITIQHEIGSQAKRTLSKFEKSGMTIQITKDDKEVLKRIRNELPQKVSALNSKSLDRLDKLVADLGEKGLLRIVEVCKDDQTIGGLFLIEFNETVLYLKGAFSDDSKKEGAMYGAMQHAIQYARSKGCHFDFGGSRVDGVRRFNLNLGGVDHVYHEYRWDNTPRWFGWLKKIKQKLR
jgi:hypothetical protein